jgi:hypothetical protein
MLKADFGVRPAALFCAAASFPNTANWRSVINKTRKHVTIAHCAIIKVDLLRASLPRSA